METNKAKFRKKAESIAPMPSASAWEKLEEKLDKVPPKKKPIRLYSILAFAASFLLLIGLLLTNNTFSAPEKAMDTGSLAEAKAESVGVEQIAIVYQDAGPYQSFYETVAAYRKSGMLKKY